MQKKDGQISEPMIINKGVRQGCELSPNLFNIYIGINKAIKEWKQITQNEIQLTSGKRVQTILYSDDQVIKTKSEDETQMAVNELTKTAKKNDMKISSSKTKTIGLYGRNIKGKIETESTITEQVCNFNYLGNLKSNEEKHNDIKL
jgi:hypothetical protein